MSQPIGLEKTRAIVNGVAESMLMWGILKSIEEQTEFFHTLPDNYRKAMHGLILIRAKQRAAEIIDKEIVERIPSTKEGQRAELSSVTYEDVMELSNEMVPEDGK